MASKASKCSACGRQAGSEVSPQRCSGCKTPACCSTDCQRRDWKAGHKQSCKIISLGTAAQATASEYTGDIVKGVRLNCTKDPGGFFEVDIPSTHAMFDTSLLEVPALIGIPMVIHRIGTQSNHRPDLDCQIATCLNIEYSNSLAPPQWQSHVGSCLVARKDKKPLSSQHLEAVWMYIDRVLDYYGDVGVKQAQALITRKEFERWFDNRKRNEARNRKSEWADVGSCLICELLGGIRGRDWRCAALQVSFVRIH